MKIDRNKLKKSSTEVPVDCRALIEKLKSASDENLQDELHSVRSWTYGKCELYHWSDILDRFDEVLEKGCKKESEKKWTLSCDEAGNQKLKELLLNVLHFTSLLIEHSFSRHLYNSMEHLTTLLSSCDMTVVLAVLNLLYVFSKRSNFITRLNTDKKQGLLVRLTHLAESWGGKENGFGLAECCTKDPAATFPASATTLHFEFYLENKEEKGLKKSAANTVTSIHMDNLDKTQKLPSEIMEELLATFKIPEEKQMLLYTHIRLAHLFSNYEARVQCVQARLQALAILVYSNAIQETMNSLLYPGLIEELVDIVELKDDSLVEIKAASLRTLTSIIHLERNPKLNTIIDATGAASYHGFLPVLVRSCIQHMTDPQLTAFPQQYATALFSFLYHLASYENGVEALVSCGMMECLLKVISWYGDGQEHITQFVTRAVRVVDLITNLDMAAFQAQGGLSIFINRLEHEVSICRKEQPFEIKTRRESILEETPSSPTSDMETDTLTLQAESSEKPSEPSGDSVNEGASTSSGKSEKPVEQVPLKTGSQCFPQRAALLKSMLNFLKKAIPDPSFSDSIRHLMEGSLPKSLRHIISNAEYYGPSLFLLATDVVTVYVFQEPSLLSSLQDSGLTDVVLHALLIKDVPATREVLASLPNVFSALCLNTRGLESFVDCKPFDRLFKVLLSQDYLPAMRRRRSSDPFGDTASNLGNAMDELMRHQPSLRTDATKAIIKLLEEVCAMGMDPKYICVKPTPKPEQQSLSIRSPQPPDTASSDEEDEEDDIPNTQESSLASKPSQESQEDSSRSATPQNNLEKQAIPLMDYVLNVMKFVEAILSNNSTDDHCREFVSQKGLQPLMSILGLPNLPIDFPASPACQAVAIVCKSILTLSREPQVLKQGLLKLEEVLQNLETLHKPLDAPGGSVLLRELANVAHLPDSTLSPQATPLLHALSSCHAYIMMFVHVCRMGQSDIRFISVSHWGSDLGLNVLRGLSKLYTSLVWESTVLLALCSEDILPAGCDFGKADMEKLTPKDVKADKEEGAMKSSAEMGSNGVSAAMESLSTSENTETPMEVNENQQQSGQQSSSDKDSKKAKPSPTLQAQVKQMKPLLSVSSRLCRALAELFGLLVKLCVGSPVRQRRTQQIPAPPTLPSAPAQAVAKALTRLLTNGLEWTPPPCSPVPKLRLTFLVCSVGFTSMLFDEKKQPFHLMLQKFVSSGGQSALFEAFEWALSLGNKGQLSEGQEQSDLPDGTGEFLDAWLMLVEKMVNPKTILESTHTLPPNSTPGLFEPFTPVQYLISTQKAAFKAVMQLWNKTPLKIYGGRMSESILAILCHIVKGENIIREHLSKEKEETPEVAPGPSSAVSRVPATPSFRPAEIDVNPSHLQQLMDMGFTREHCMEALTHTTSLEQATDYILTHPPSTAASSNAGSSNQRLGMVMEMSEEDQMMQAIALSLGESVVMTTDQGQPSAAAATLEAQPEEQAPVPEANKPEEIIDKEQKENPLDKAVLDQFSDSVLPGCLTLLDTLPETVYRVCDLLIVVTQRNGVEWQKKVLSSLAEEIHCLGKQLLSNGSGAQKGEVSDTEKKETNTEASKFAARLHLFSLLFEEMMMPCAETLEHAYLIDLLVQVLNSGQEFLSVHKDSITPKWLAPLLLLLDLYEKVSVISKRKAEADKLLAESHTWKWFDDSSGRWCKYSISNNKAIDDAYRADENCVRFQVERGRRRYTINFISMVQVNEETGNRRPIMLTLPSVEEKQQSKEDIGESSGIDPTENKMETEALEKSEKKSKETVVVSGLNPDQITSITRSVVSLLNIPVEAECLHAALRLTLRLTRDHKCAILFAELGGPKLLLSLTQSSSFHGFISLATLIFRHILEEPLSLKYCMEKVVRKATSGSGSSASGVQQGTLGSKELHYVMRVLGPAACRSPHLFADVAKSALQIALPAPSKRDEDESRFTSPNAPQILKSVPMKQMTLTTVESPIKEVLYDLLDCLTVEYTENDESVSTGLEVQPPQTLAEAMAEVANETANLARQGSSADLPTDDQSSQDNGAGGSGKEQSKDKESKQEDVRKQRPLMPKSSVLRLLSEIVKSYSSCTQLITQYTYQTRQTTLVPEECTVLAFVLDNLLPHCQIFGDKDCPALSRVFIASIASCNHCPDAQMTLVGEIKGALQRALLLPESAVKHTRIRALTNLISVIIESCPSPGQVPNQVFKGQQSVMNNIVKSLLKKGLVTDLARIPHCLDLSSPYMASTVNSALKPLETLSRSVNQPAQGVIAKAKKSDIETTIQQATEPTELNTTVAETVAAPAESSQVDSVTIEDISNQVDQNNDLEETEPLDAVEPDMDSQAEVENELEEVLDVLLNRDARGNSGGPGLGDIVMDSEDISQVSGHDDEDHDPSGVIIDVAEDLDHHDSQMVSQAISIDEDDGDETAHDMHNDDESGSDADDDGDGDGDDDEDDDDDDDDDDGDDDEEDEDDEGSDMEAEEEDEYHDIETSINTLNDYGDNFLMEDMFSMGGGAGQHVIFNALDNGHTMRNFGGFQLPISLHDNDNGNEDAVPNIPPAPSSVQPMHPLLVRQPDTQTVMGVQRLHRSRNQRGTCRYNPSTQTLHVNFPRQPNPPVILQRLLGPSTAADVLQLTSTLTSVAGPTPTRLVLANDDLRIISRPEEDLYDELFHDSYADNNPSGSGVLTSVPSTLARWTEEAKVLDGNSVHDCVTALKPVIIESLEKRRDEELAERREKRRKQTEEEAAKKEKGANADINKTVEWNTSQNMEISHTTEDAAGYVDSSVSAPSITTLATSAVTPAATTSGRQISASEAAAAAELIATAVVEGILSTPAMATTATPSLQQQTESAQANAGSTAPTFLTPAQPMPIVSPMAPRFNRAVQRTSDPASTCNLASLLQHDAAEGETPTGETSMLSTSRASTDRRATAQDATVSGNQLSSDLAANQASLDGIITPEEVSGISSSDAVTIQSSESSEELNTGVDGPESTTSTAVSSSAEQASMVTDTLSSAYNILTPSSFSGDPVSVSALTSSMLGALSASISAPPSLLSSAHGLSIPTTGARASDSQPATASTAGPSGTSSSQGTAFGDLPEGVDPSFLAALPENIRQEVIAEQLRLQRIQQSAREQAQNARTTGSVEVNAEFLAALPPNIQEEVLAQQRTEQARIQAQQQSTTTASETPVDPASFLATLPSSLRQQVLADMDDSMVAVLPPDLAAEAQSLRRELEERHRRLMQERLFPQSNAGSLSAILRQSGFGGRLGPGRYAIRAIPSRGIPRSGSQWAWGSGRLGGQAGSNQNSVKFKGRHMLDHEALTCLLVLLFVDEPKLQTSRLHRVLRNLCYHGPTRLWVIRALLSILQKTGECKLEEEKGKSLDKGKRKGSTSENDVTFKSDTKSQGSWLSISLEASLGCRANVFQIQKSGKKHTAGNTGSVTVHQQASPVVCRHVLDTLIALAKVFPGQFLPSNKAKEADNCDIMEDKQDNDRQNKQGATPTVPSTSVSNSPKSTEPNSSKSETDFWDLLVKLDSLSGNRKGKSVQKAHSTSGFEGEASFHSFDTSPIGQLMTMLSHPVIKRSQLLTDRLLRLLGLVSLALPDMTQENKPATSLLTTTSTPAAITSGSANTLSISNSLPGVTPVTRSQGVTADPHLQSETATSQMSHEEKAARLKERRESQKDKEEEAPLILEEQLQLAVQVLTSKSCSEEGLEDATNLLLQLSWASNATRRAVLKLLLEGARVLGMTVCSHISTLLEELKDFGNKVREDQEEDKDMETMPSNPSKGVLLNRFEVHNNIVVAAPKKIKAGRELQLPSMTLLTSKTSSQQFFLRILKVITQLRDAVKTVVKQNSRRAEFAERDITEAMSVLQREAEAIMEMVNGRLQRNHNSGQLQQQQSEQSDQTEASSSEQQSETPASDTEPSTNSGPAAPSSQSSAETPMDVDQPGTSSDKKEAALEDSSAILPRLSDQLNLDELWQTLGDCLSELAKTPDHHAVLILQPAVEAFFIVHAGEKESKSQELPSQKKEDQLAHLNIDMAPASPAASSTEPPASPSTSDTPASTSKDSSVMSASSGPFLPQDTQKFLKFAETHRTVLNQILRQSTTPLSDGPFSVLVDHTRILDFDVKRRYFRQELERLDEGIRREDLAVHVRREHVFEDSFRELFRRTADEWKHRFYIVFEGEEGQDAGGLLREWYIIISREIFNPMYALFRTSPGDRVTYTINPSSHCNSNHLSYYKFVGRIIAKAIYDNKLLECYFTRSFYKHIIGQLVKYTDMESEDYAFYQGLVFLLEHHVEDLGYDLTFSTEIQEFGVTEVRDMKPNGRNMVVTEENKKEYVKLVCQMKMTSAIKQQLSAFMEGFYDIIPKRLISIFNEQELELLISGLPSIDIDDLKANSEYHKYQQNSLQVQWFWRALRSFEQADRAKFLQFVTGTSKVPLQGFAYLEGMNGYQKFQIHRDDRSTDRLPVAHTCFNQLDLPAYETYDKLRRMLLLAINECSEGFGLA